MALFCILVLSFLFFSACENDILGNGNGNGNGNGDVWTTYTGDYFNFDYPGSWLLVESGEFLEVEGQIKFVTVADSEEEEDTTKLFSVQYTIEGQTEITEEMWEEMKEFIGMPFGFDFVDTEIGGNPAIQGQGLLEEEGEIEIEEEVEAIVVFVYDGLYMHFMIYGSIVDHFNEELGDRILNSFQFH